MRWYAAEIPKATISVETYTATEATRNNERELPSAQVVEQRWSGRNRCPTKQRIERVAEPSE